MKFHVALETTYAEGTKVKAIEASYLIVDAQLPYNFVLGRPSINALETVISIRYLILKYLLPDGRVGTILGDQQST